MRITSKGQVTIPQALREKTGLLPYVEVEFELDGKDLRIRRARKPTRETRGQILVRRLQGTGSGKLTTDEIMKLTRGEDD